MKVSAIIIPIYRPNAFSDHYLVRRVVGDQFSQAYLILPEGVDRTDKFTIDLSKKIPENLIHVVVGDDGKSHVEPYLPASDGKTPYSKGPTYVHINRCTADSGGWIGLVDVFLELWDRVPPGLERPELQREFKYIAVSERCIRFVE